MHVAYGLIHLRIFFSFPKTFFGLVSNFFGALCRYEFVSDSNSNSFQIRFRFGIRFRFEFEFDFVSNGPLAFVSTFSFLFAFCASLTNRHLFIIVPIMRFEKFCCIVNQIERYRTSYLNESIFYLIPKQRFLILQFTNDQTEKLQNRIIGALPDKQADFFLSLRIRDTEEERKKAWVGTLVQ